LYEQMYKKVERTKLELILSKILAQIYKKS